MNELKTKSLLTCTPFLIVILFFFLANASWAQLTVNAGANKIICTGDSVRIGGFPAASGGTFPYTYTWIPSVGLNDPTIANPIAFPIITTVYTLTVKDAATSTVSSSVTVTVGQIPLVDAGSDTTIQEGSVAILYAHGANRYVWSPANTLKYSRTPIAEAYTKDTTVYYLEGYDVTETCSAIDSMIVYVIPSNKVVLYNTFTPNGDNNNDVWYIGNIEKFPDNHLDIYNRYGKKVFEMYNYDNSWGGMALGEKLPAATYFYVLDLGNGEGVYNGTVTIVD